MTETQTFTHHGRTFAIEAEDWPSEDAASTAMIDLQSWTMQLGLEDAAALHDALDKEREALVSETAYDRNAPPLLAVRAAQRQAMRAGMQGQTASGLQPTVSLEAWEVSIAPA